MTTYPRYVVGTGSDSVFKFFNPTLGVALTDGCFMTEGTVVFSENGMRPFDPEKDFLPEYADSYTEELVATRANKGSVERPFFDNNEQYAVAA